MHLSLPDFICLKTEDHVLLFLKLSILLEIEILKNNINIFFMGNWEATPPSIRGQFSF